MSFHFNENLAQIFALNIANSKFSFMLAKINKIRSTCSLIERMHVDIDINKVQANWQVLKT